MNQIKAANPRRLVFFSIILVVMLAVLLIWARDIIREVIVLPISYLVWAGRILLFVVPEIYFWMAVVAIGMLMAWRAISGKPVKVMDVPLGAKAEMPSEVSRGRVSFWHTKVRLVRHGASAYYLSTFQTSLALLLMEMLAHRYRLTNLQVEERLRLDPDSEQGRLMGLHVPDYVREYILSRLHYRDLVDKPFWTRVWENVNDLIRSLRRSLSTLLRGSENDSVAQPIDPRVERIIKYMEEELEVPNDDNGR